MSKYLLNFPEASWSCLRKERLSLTTRAVGYAVWLEVMSQAVPLSRFYEIPAAQDYRIGQQDDKLGQSTFESRVSDVECRRNDQGCKSGFCYAPEFEGDRVEFAGIEV